jgi:hypothetical protein
LVKTVSLEQVSRLDGGEGLVEYAEKENMEKKNVEREN